MCVVSMVTRDFYENNKTAPWMDGSRWFTVRPGLVDPFIRRSEFEKLKVQFEELAKDIAQAKQQDINEGNPDCEKEESIELLKAIAEKLGINLNL